MNKHHHTVPFLIDESNLSVAWAKAVIKVIDGAGVEIAPLIISITGFDENGVPAEKEDLRQALDELLIAKKFKDIENVAFTIFPQRLWQIAQGDRKRLFEFYGYSFPRFQAMNPRDNRRGLYFERLVSYGRGPFNGNQLEWILSQFNSRVGVRRSMLQASVFDPARDHVADAQLQFPCLQHVSFEPTSDGLVVNAFYATQQLFVKAYGNYLGIAQLGAFMAHEMQMKLVRMNVIIGVAKLDKIPKTDPGLTALLSIARACINSSEKLDIEIGSISQSTEIVV